MAQVHAIHEAPGARAAIVFVHGLGGDAQGTWMSNPRDPTSFWPRWLADDVPGVAVWTLAYDADVSAWTNQAMPLPDQGIGVLETLCSEPRLALPLVFVGHSLGGLVIKTVLCHGLDQGVPRYETLARRVRGIAFVATPHNGSNIANLALAMRFLLRTNEQVRDLGAHDAHLRALHGRFLNYRQKLAIPCRTYCETRGMPLGRRFFGLFAGARVLVVDETSAEPNIPNERAVPLPEDHGSIAKPRSRDAPLYKSMLIFLRECLDAPPAAVPAPPATAAPASALPPGIHTLRAPVADFVERRQLAGLRSRMLTGGVALLALQGTGGVGKSEMARRLAHDLVGRYPDAQWEFDLQGASANPRSPEDVMARVLRSLHPGQALPMEPEALQALYLEALASRRALLLLDNARDADQVQPLLPPAGCAAIVTSRQRFTLPGLHTEALGQLDAAEARRLALAIAGQRPGVEAQVGELVTLCDCWALAVRVAASTLAESRAVPIDVYLGMLRHTPSAVLPAIARVIDASLALLDDTLQKHWRLLGAMASDFDAEAAQGLWDPDADDLASSTYLTLDALHRASLIEIASGDAAAAPRYRLHDLARDHALAQLRRHGEERLARLFHATHYLLGLQTNDERFLAGHEGEQEALAWFDREWPQLEAMQRFVADAVAAPTLDEVDARRVRLAALAPNSGVNMLNLRLHPREHLQWLEAGVEASRRLDDPATELTHLGNIGALYMNRGLYAQAVDHFKRSLRVARQLGDRAAEGNLLGNLGGAARLMRDPTGAKLYYGQAIDIARELKDRRAEGGRLGNLGNACGEMDDWPGAVAHFEQSLAIARETGDGRGQAARLSNLAVAWDHLGEPRKALAYGEQSLEVARRLKDRSAEGNALNAMGTVWRGMDESRRAVSCYEEALAIAIDLGQGDSAARRGFNLALALNARGDRAGACARMREARDRYAALQLPEVQDAQCRLAEWGCTAPPA